MYGVGSWEKGEVRIGDTTTRREPGGCLALSSHFSNPTSRHAVTALGTRIEVSCSMVAGAFDGAFSQAATRRKKQINATRTM